MQNSHPPMIQGTAFREKFVHIDELVEHHFSKFSEPSHPCRITLSAALKKLDHRPAFIIETGSSAWGANSSQLFDSYVNSFGGHFISVDIRDEPMKNLQNICTSLSTFVCDDSANFLRNFSRSGLKPDLIYLDSWDVDWSNPIPAEIHGLAEFLYVFPCLKPGALLLVDDTPKNIEIMEKVQNAFTNQFNLFQNVYGISPGKGGLIKNFLEKNGIGHELMHEYQLLWKF